MTDHLTFNDEEIQILELLKNNSKAEQIEILKASMADKEGELHAQTLQDLISKLEKSFSQL